MALHSQANGSTAVFGERMMGASARQTEKDFSRQYRTADFSRQFKTLHAQAFVNFYIVIIFVESR